MLYHELSPITREIIADAPDLAELFIERDRLGWETYGKPMNRHDGTDWRKEAIEECADLCQYLKAGRMDAYWLALSILQDLVKSS